MRRHRLNEVLSVKANRGGLGSHEVLVAIGGQVVVAEEGITFVRWPREAAGCTKMIRNQDNNDEQENSPWQHHSLHPLGILNGFHWPE